MALHDKSLNYCLRGDSVRLIFGIFRRTLQQTKKKMMVIVVVLHCSELMIYSCGVKVSRPMLALGYVIALMQSSRSIQMVRFQYPMVVWYQRNRPNGPIALKTTATRTNAKLVWRKTHFETVSNNCIAIAADRVKVN
jgi:hypothetical protein